MISRNRDILLSRYISIGIGVAEAECLITKKSNGDVDVRPLTENEVKNNIIPSNRIDSHR